MEKVKFGIIGCGVIGPWHARAISNTSEAELVAVCDIVPEKAQKLAANFGVPKIYTDYREMLADPEIEAVCICTPSGLHADMAMDAAKAGKHVMSEKPMDITLQKIDEMIKTCKHCNVKLAVIFQRRTSPMWHKIKRAVESGKLGKVVLGDAYLKYYRGQEYYDSGNWRGTWALDGGGALMNQGVHMIDILQWIMGPVESIFAYAAPLVRQRIEVEDTAVACIRFKSGAFGVLEGTTSVNPGMDHRLEVHGELGSILVKGEEIAAWNVPGDDQNAPGEHGNGGVDIKLGTAATEPTSIATEGHQVQIADLARAIREDREPMVSGEEARKAVEIILAIYESSRTGKQITLPLAY